MKRKRHTEEQIIAILKEHEAGMKTADLCRKHGISDASFYNWKAKYGGLEVSETKRLKGLESDSRRAPASPDLAPCRRRWGSSRTSPWRRMQRAATRSQSRRHAGGPDQPPAERF
jgi:putative transposase